MRSLSRTAACCAALALTFFGASVSTFVGFGGAVLVGDGEIFVGEAANNFRPGTVYVYRRGGSAWQEAASLTAPNGAVGDQFGSALALDGTRLFVASGQVRVEGVGSVAAGQQLAEGAEKPAAAPRVAHLVSWTRDLRNAAPLVPA